MSHHGIDPLKKATLASMVTEKMRELIVQGYYEPGAQLNEVDLATRFGVSRGPIREGLRQLVHEGLLRSEPHRGAFVPRMTASDIADIHEAREAIESAAMKTLIETARNVEASIGLNKVVQAIDRALKSRNWSRVAELDLLFHTELVGTVGNERLLRMYRALLDETRICIRLATGHMGPREMVQDHAEIVQSLTSGDLSAALEALSRHLRGSVAALLTEVPKTGRSAGAQKTSTVAAVPGAAPIAQLP